MAKPPNKKPPAAPAKRELDQQGVLILRPDDQFMVIQNGRQKLMLVATFTQAIREIMAEVASEMIGVMAVPARTHAEGDIVNLGTDLAAIINALNGKAPLNHTHPIGQITGNFVDATSFPPVAYNGVYPVVAKATVSGGNAVFQLYG